MRLIGAGNRAALLGVELRPALFIEAEFRTAFLRLWTGSGKITWKGQEWSAPSGAREGAVLSMETVTESSGVEATGLKFVLTGLPADLLGYCLDELRISKKCRVWLGFLDSAGALLDDPTPLFEGWMDASEIEESAESPRITVFAETELRRLKIPSRRMLTAEDQKIDFPLDTAFRWMPSVQNFKGNWGAQQIAGSGGGAGGNRATRDLDFGGRLLE